MRKKSIIALQLLHGVLIMTSLFSGISLILSLFYPERQTEIFLREFIILVPFFVTYFAARKVKSIFTFLLISLVSMVPVFFVAPTIIEKVLYLLPCMIVMIIRIVSRVREDGYDALMDPIIGILALFVILYIVGVLTKNDLVTKVNYYLVFAYTILIIIYKNATQLEGYLAFNSSVENIPVRQIRKNNKMLMLGFLAMVVAAMVLLPMSGMSNLITLLGRGLRQAFIFLIGLFSKEGGPPPAIAETEAAAGGQQGMGFMGDMTDTPAWVTALYNSLTYALAVVVGILILSALITAVYRLIRKFYRPSFENNDEAVFLDPLSGADSMDRSGRLQRPLWLSFDPNSVIRKQYRKMIYKHVKHIDRTSYTPEELEEFAEVPADERRALLHGLYEKARYSEDGCTRDDVQALKG